MKNKKVSIILPCHNEELSISDTLIKISASIGVYNSKEDIDILCNAINNCKKVFNI